MKIMQITQFFSPNFGGSSIVPFELIKQLEKKHDVTVLTTDYQLNDAFTKHLTNAEVLPFKCKIDLQGLLYSPSMNEYLRKNNDRFDIIHMHNYRSYQNIQAYKYAMRNKIPYIVQAHGSILPFHQKVFFKSIFDFYIGNKILANSSNNIAVTSLEFEQYRIMGVGKDKIKIIPNGIDITKYDGLVAKGIFRKKLNLTGDIKLILFMGRLHNIKGIDFLIKSFKLLTNEIDNVVLVLAGPDYGYKNYLGTLVNGLGLDEKVLFTGFIENVIEAYADADIIVCPSVYEIFGLVPLEAIMCGTPVIVTDGCGCSELIQKARCGHLVKYGDEKGLKEKMRLILDDALNEKNMVNNGKTFIKENLSWDNIAKKVEILYESSIDGY